jgi:hypothetical protein
MIARAQNSSISALRFLQGKVSQRSRFMSRVGLWVLIRLGSRGDFEGVLESWDATLGGATKATF